MLTRELALRQTEDMLGERRELADALLWSNKTLQNIRNKKLRTLLTYAKVNSPWYKRHLANINMESFTEDHLKDIPPIDKVTLMENWDEIVTDRKLSLSIAEQHIERMKNDGDVLHLMERYHVLATSGSSGKRGVFIYNLQEFKITR